METAAVAAMDEVSAISAGSTPLAVQILAIVDGSHCGCRGRRCGRGLLKMVTWGRFPQWSWSFEMHCP